MSKELKALEQLKYYNIIANDDFDMTNELAIIETALKALKIIKDKQVNVFIFLHSGDLETYNDMVEDNRKLTQEEYNLLKEVLL